jgi:hypothetical protein
MARRTLTEEEKKAIAEKEWKVTPIFSSNEKLVNSMKNLTGPKTPEGRARSLANLQVGKNKGESGTMRHGGYIRRVLNEEEMELYNARKEDYENDFEMNKSSDEITLHQALMEEVIYYRLMLKLGEKPSLSSDSGFNMAVTDCLARLNKALSNLGSLRTQRLKQDEKSNDIISIATIAQRFAKELMSGSVKDELDASLDEEAKFLADKERREAMTLDADYEVIDDESDE